MLYFTYISQEYACKNKLEKAVSNLLRSYERRVLTVSGMKSVRVQIAEEIANLNLTFPRCKRIIIAFVKHSEEVDIHAQITGGICNFHFYSSPDTSISNLK